MGSQHPRTTRPCRRGPKSALGGTLTSPRGWSQLCSGSGPKFRLLHAAKASSSPSLVLHPAGAGRNRIVPSRWEGPFLSTKPRSSVPGWVSAESLSGEQRAPQSHCWGGQQPLCRTRYGGLASPAAGVRSELSRLVQLQRACSSPGAVWSKPPRWPEPHWVPPRCSAGPPISVALGWGSLRGVEPHALRGGTFAASVSVWLLGHPLLRGSPFPVSTLLPVDVASSVLLGSLFQISEPSVGLQADLSSSVDVVSGWEQVDERPDPLQPSWDPLSQL